MCAYGTFNFNSGFLEAWREARTDSIQLSLSRLLASVIFIRLYFKSSIYQFDFLGVLHGILYRPHGQSNSNMHYMRKRMLSRSRSCASLVRTRGRTPTHTHIRTCSQGTHKNNGKSCTC